MGMPCRACHDAAWLLAHRHRSCRPSTPSCPHSHCPCSYSKHGSKTCGASYQSSKPAREQTQLGQLACKLPPYAHRSLHRQSAACLLLILDSFLLLHLHQCFAPCLPPLKCPRIVLCPAPLHVVLFVVAQDPSGAVVTAPPSGGQYGQVLQR